MFHCCINSKMPILSATVSSIVLFLHWSHHHSSVAHHLHQDVLRLWEARRRKATIDQSYPNALVERLIPRPSMTGSQPKKPS